MAKIFYRKSDYAGFARTPAFAGRMMIFGDYVVYHLGNMPAAGVGPSNGQNKVLKAIWLVQDDELSTLEHVIHRTARAYIYEFRQPGEVFSTRYTKRKLFADAEGTGDRK